MTERTSPPAPCPDLESWCAFVDGSSPGDEAAALVEHLSVCDRCFETVSQLRRDLRVMDDPAEAEEAVGEPWREVRAAARRAGLTAAATLALLWIGLWQVTARFPGPGGPASARSPDGLLGFVRRPDPGVLRGPVRVLVVFTQFASEGLEEVPDWARGLFENRRGGSLLSTCSEVSESLSLVGQVLPDRYRSRLPAPAYSAADDGSWRRYVSEILRQVDADTDLSAFDRNGDRTVDFVFVVLGSAPEGFLPGGAADRAGLGVDYESADTDRAGEPIGISGSSLRGALVTEEAGRTVRDMCSYLEQATRP